MSNRSENSMRSFAFAVTAIVALTSPCLGEAADWYVDLNSTAAEPDGMSWETAFRDVQSAINVAAIGKTGDTVLDPEQRDRIHVAPGRYLLSETIACGKYVRIFGVTDKALKNGDIPDAQQVILDGQNSIPCMEVGAGVEFYGVTFANGRRDVFSDKGDEVYAGGGLSVTQAANSPSGIVISNCVFRKCVSGTFRDTGTASCIYGGGAGLRAILPKVYETLFEDCGITNGCKSVAPQYVGLRMRGGAVYGVSGACSGNIFRRNFISDPMRVWAGDKYGSAVYAVGALTDNCLFESNYFNTVERKAGETLGDENRGHTFSNLVFVGNRAPAGFGFRAGEGAVVSHCSFIGNTSSQAGWGCLKAPLPGSDSLAAGISNTVVRNCLFLDNYTPDGGGDNSGVCIHSHCGDSNIGIRSLRVTDCSFVRNATDGTYASRNNCGQACISTWSGCGAYVLISNCVFEANQNATNTTSAKALVNLNQVSNYDIVDCMFKDNVSGQGGKVGIVYAPGYDLSYGGGTTNSSIRNCVFVNNKCSNAISASTPVTDSSLPGVRIENCTLAGNTLSGSKSVIADLSSASCRVFIYNTALYNNMYNKVYNLGTAWADHVFNSYIGPQNAARTVFDKDGNIVTDVDPKFVDTAHGDYRLQKTSPLVDAGQLRPWIGKRSRKQPDMSNVVSVYDASGKVSGCTVVRNPVGCRFDGAKPDIGAYEYNLTRGLLVVVR